MKAEYFLLALVTFVVLIVFTFVVYPIIAIFCGIVFGFFGILLDFGTSAGDFMVSIATVPWKNWPISLPSVFVLSVVYAFISKKMHEK